MSPDDAVQVPPPPIGAPKGARPAASQRSKPLLCVALDVPSRHEAEAVLAKLDGLTLVYKIGLELFVAEGPSLVRSLTVSGKPVFLDLKLHDIPNTVASAAHRAADLGVDYLTVHLVGGRAMCESARDSFAKGKAGARLLGVTVLTSFDEAGWSEISSSVGTEPRPLFDSVQALASCAEAWGVPGIVASPKELPMIRSKYPALFPVIPGIRQAGSAAGDQKRVVTPAEAAREGAGLVVVGRPILQASDMRGAAESILREIEGA